MAWQNEQELHKFNSNVTIIGNIDVASITHSGNNLRVTGTVALGARGTSGYYCYYVNGITEVPGNGVSVKILGDNEKLYTGGGNDKHAAFDVTIPNVSSGTTSYSFPVRFRAWYNNSGSTYWDVTKYWTITFPVSGGAPIGGYVTYNSCTWNSITATGGVTDWNGGTPGYQNHVAVLTGETNGAAASATALDVARREYFADGNSALSVQRTMTTDNTSQIYGGNALAIKGLLTYRLGYWMDNTLGNSSGVVQTTRYLPPSPLQSITYTQTQNSTNVTVNAVITGGSSANNYSDSVTTYYRYSTNGGSSYTGWTSAGTGSTWVAKTASFNCNYGASVVVQAKQTYHSMDSEVKQISFTATTGTAPSGGIINVVGSTWNSISLAASGVSYGKPDGINGRKIAVGVGDGYQQRNYKRENQFYNVTSANTTVDNNSVYPSAQPLQLKGMLPVYPYIWAYNTVTAADAYWGQVYYLPPAPGVGSYEETISGTYTVSYTGVSANNYVEYDLLDLTRTVRYKIAGTPNWTYVDNDAQKPINANTTFNITLLSGASAVVEAWLTYKGKNSEVTTFTITNSSDPVGLYGSVNGQTKAINKLYGPVNGVSKKIVKLYGSVDGVARLVFEDNS